eukprot:gene15465-20866_t
MRGILIVILMLRINDWTLANLNNQSRMNKSSENLAYKYVYQTILQRLNMLRSITYNKYLSKQSCSTTVYIAINDTGFGRSGNNLIEFTNLLWLSDIINGTVIVPKWMNEVLNPFDETYLSKSFCYTKENKVISNSQSLEPIIMDREGKNIELYRTHYHRMEISEIIVFQISSIEAFFIHRLYRNNLYKQLLPALTVDLVNNQISKYFVRVYSLLWSHPLKSIISSATTIILESLQGNFNYMSAHRRLLEGQCYIILTSSDLIYNSNELPLYGLIWTNSNFTLHHPLCEMSVPFIKEVISLHQRNHTYVYIAHDGQGNLSDYNNPKERNPIFVLSNPKNTSDLFDWKFVDMLVAMNSDLFVLNPASTFSWEIFVIRACLGLKSIPIIKDNDIYMRKSHAVRSHNKTFWVSWGSVLHYLQNTHE